MNLVRWVYLLAGWICLLLGFIGIWVPLLPTTPFVLLAAFCFSRGSVRLHRWLRETRLFGPVIRDWEACRGIRTSAKIKATIMIVAVFTVTLLVTAIPLPAKGLLVLLAVSLLAYLWTRPVPAVHLGSPE
ncbi:MAG: YbaN family protein [candidate division FCPU426 bacterium]